MANQNPQQGQEKQGQKGQQAGQQSQDPAKKSTEVTDPDGTAGHTPDPNQDKGQQSKP